MEIWHLGRLSLFLFFSHFLFLLLNIICRPKKKKIFSLFFNAFLKRLQKQRLTPQITSQKCIIFLLLTTSPWNCQLSQRSVIDITLSHSNIRLNTLFGCSEKKNGYSFSFIILRRFGPRLVRLRENSKYTLFPWLEMNLPITFQRLRFFSPKAHGSRWSIFLFQIFEKTKFAISLSV